MFQTHFAIEIPKPSDTNKAKKMHETSYQTRPGVPLFRKTR